MANELRHRRVAVAVVFDPADQTFLLARNKRWNGDAFPMKRIKPDDQAGPGPVAVDALREAIFPATLANTSSSPLDRVGECLFSEAVQEFTYYDYHLIGIDPQAVANRGELNSDVRFLTFDQLISDPDVTSSTKTIARDLVEDRKVALAVIPRGSPRDPEFLLVHNANARYFFPATRMKDVTRPADAAVRALREDVGYQGEVSVVDQSEVDVLQDSTRFGPRMSRFHFHACYLDVDAAAIPHGTWFNEIALRTRADMSPSVEKVLATVLQLTERNA